MERANLLLCPKTSTSTWRKLRSTPLTLLVKQTLLSTPLCVVQTLLKLSCSFMSWIQNIYSLFLYSQTASIFLFWLTSIVLLNLVSLLPLLCFYFQCCVFSWSTSGWSILQSMHRVSSCSPSATTVSWMPEKRSTSEPSGVSWLFSLACILKL